MSQSQEVAVVGGGFAGLLAAWLLSEQNQQHQPSRIVVIEQAAELGGLMRSHDYGDGGIYDHGAHNVSESGIPELDQKLCQLLAAPDWQRLEGSRRDLAGLYVNGQLQTHTQFVDLRNWPQTDYRRWLGDFFAQLEQRSPREQFTDARSQLEHSFGPLLTQELFAPLLRGLYQSEPEDLHPLALSIVPMTRFAAFSGQTEAELLASPLLRRHIAFSQQRELPPEYSSGLASFYPTQPGIGQWVSLLQELLSARGVELLPSTQITGLRHQAGQISSLQLKLADGSEREQTVSQVFWSAGLPPLARLLGLHPGTARPAPPIKLALCHLLLSEAPLMEDLYYFYCLDRRYSLFRACHYTAYCPQAGLQGGFPMTVEIFAEGETTPESLLKRVMTELRDMGILTSVHQLLFGHAELGQQGLPVPSVQNLQLFDQLRGQLRGLGFGNLELLGLMAEEGQTFQRDIMRDTYQKIQAWCQTPELAATANLGQL